MKRVRGGRGRGGGQTVQTSGGLIIFSPKSVYRHAKFGGGSPAALWHNLFDVIKKKWLNYFFFLLRTKTSINFVDKKIMLFFFFLPLLIYYKVDRYNPISYTRKDRFYYWRNQCHQTNHGIDYVLLSFTTVVVFAKKKKTLLFHDINVASIHHH